MGVESGKEKKIEVWESKKSSLSHHYLSRHEHEVIAALAVEITGQVCSGKSNMAMV